MKKYMKPTMEGQMFVSNEFVAVCGSQTSYKFKCDAGLIVKQGIFGPYKEATEGELYDSNWNPSNCLVEDYWGDEYLTNSYHACNETHSSSTTDNYIPGWFDTNNKPNDGIGETKVYIWQEVENGVIVNHHATESIQDIVSQINRS